MHYIYKITIIPNNKIYIGQTKDISKRWYQHKAEAQKDSPSMTVNDAMKKYGIENCKIEIIDFAQNYWQADCLEQNYIKQFDSHIKNGKGYNVSLGGPVAPKTEEWRAAMSAIKGGWLGREEELSERMKGNTYASVPHTEESDLKRSQSMKKKVEDGWVPVNIFTSETAAVWQGKSLSEEHKKNISKGLMGREVSEETRQKISESQIGKIISEEQRQQISETSKGKHYSPETEFQKGLTPWNKGKKMGPSSKRGIKTGIIPPNKGQKKTLTEAQLTEINKLLAEGKSLRKIGETLGVARHFISKELKRMGS